MFKRDLIIPILFFALFTLKQLIFNDTISWIDNAGIAMFIFLFYVLWDWSGKPYDWKKSRKSTED